MVSSSTFRVGLTGGIASGKSTVAKLFAALGVAIIDADAIAREVVEPGSLTLQRIAARFGSQFLQSDGNLDRGALRQLVFADANARADLEALMHPAIWELIEQRSATLNGTYQMLVIPLLVENGRATRVNRVLVVDCDQELQIRRLQARDHSTRAAALAILGAQASRAQRLAAADDVIVNDSGLDALREQVQALHARYRALAAQART
jgi:dephospho-CoA kinase